MTVELRLRLGDGEELVIATGTTSQAGALTAGSTRQTLVFSTNRQGEGPMTVPQAMVAALSTACLATALLTGCSSSDQQPTPPSNADLVPTSVAPLPDSSKAQVFENALARRSLSIPAPAAVAGQVCAGFDRNDAAPAIVADVQQLTGLDAGNAAYVLGASVSVYCPQSLDELRRSVG